MSDLRKKLRAVAERELDVAVQAVREAAARQAFGIAPSDLLKLAAPGKDKTLRAQVLTAMVRAKEAAIAEDLFSQETRDAEPDRTAA